MNERDSRLSLLLLAVALTASLAACKKEGGGGTAGKAQAPLRLGFFPNITHSQALVGHADGTFAKALPGIELKQFNAGPAAMEALTGGSIDAAYVGPGPAINTFLKAGRELRVIAAAVNGGAVLVTKTVSSPEQMKGKTIASPQLGNTQDIALRHWIQKNGMKVVEGGADGVTVSPLANPDILNLFSSGKLEGAWVPEPWGARMIAAGGKLFLDERDLWPDRQFPATLLVTTRKALESRPEEIKKLLLAHLELTQRWTSDPAQFVGRVNDSFTNLTGKRLADDILENAFSRIEPTLVPREPTLRELAKHAKELGFVKTDDVAGLVDLKLLEQLQGAAAPTGAGVGGAGVPAEPGGKPDASVAP